jgi:glucokinase
MTVIGVDIGGTKIAAGVVGDRAEIITSRVVETRAAEGFDVSIAQLWRVIEDLRTPEVQAIGICAPGPLDPLSGIVLNPPNLPGWVNLPLAAIAHEKFALPVLLENDCNAAGLAETRYGAARGCRHVFYAGIGTGIGTGIILNGEIYHGAHGAAGEGGHVTIDYRSSIVCGCGVAGCIEALASGPAIEKHKLDLDQTTERIGAWLGAMVSLLDPEIIVIGGGVARIGEPLFSRLREIVPQKTINPFQPKIVPAKFDSGIIGAAAVAMVGQVFNPRADL